MLYPDHATRALRLRELLPEILSVRKRGDKLIISAGYDGVTKEEAEARGREVAELLDFGLFPHDSHTYYDGTARAIPLVSEEGDFEKLGGLRVTVNDNSGVRKTLVLGGLGQEVFNLPPIHRSIYEDVEVAQAGEPEGLGL